MKWEPRCSTRGRENGRPWIRHSLRRGWELRMLTHRLKSIGGFSTRIVDTFETFDECLAASKEIPPDHQPAWWPFDYFTNEDVSAVESGAAFMDIIRDIQNGSRGTYDEQLARIMISRRRDAPRDRSNAAKRREQGGINE